MFSSVHLVKIVRIVCSSITPRVQMMIICFILFIFISSHYFSSSDLKSLSNNTQKILSITLAFCFAMFSSHLLIWSCNSLNLLQLASYSSSVVIFFIFSLACYLLKVLVKYQGVLLSYWWGILGLIFPCFLFSRLFFRFCFYLAQGILLLFHSF